VLTARDRWFGIAGEFELRECTHCRLAVTEPRLEGEALARYYPSDYDAWQRRHDRLRALRSSLARVRAGLPPFGVFKRRGEGTLLDVGCGRGDLASNFIRAGWHGCGIDISPSAVAAAREVGVNAHVGTMESAPWADGTFDLIIMNHSLEHIADPLGALRRARSLLKEDGALIVAVPNWDSWQRRTFGTYWTPLDVPRHVTHFSPHALHLAARLAGYARGRTRNYVTGVGLPMSTWFWSARRPLTGRLQPGMLLAGGLLYPLSWALGRLFGGDATYLVADA
jgi:SAM-dependent methyltransferase